MGARLDRHALRGHGVHVLTALLLGALALAAPTIVVDATVGDDLATVYGTVQVSGSPRVHWIDPLAALPLPADDRTALRTWPGAPERGMVRFSPVDDDTWRFHAVLPRRYGDIGTTRHGLFANGGWMPQPMIGDRPAEAAWEVTVRVPDGTLGVVGDAVALGVVHWSGEGERASLAVVRRARADEYDLDGLHATVVSRRARPARDRHLPQQLRLAWSTVGVTASVAVVEAPLRRRLVRPGVATAYLSDRAWRVTPGLHRTHHVAVTRGIVEAALPMSDRYARSIAAASISAHHAEILRGLDARGALRLLSWMPRIDALLYDRRMPFVSDVLEEVVPGDVLHDDLLEVLDPLAPGTQVAGQVLDRWGEAALAAFGAHLVAGEPLPEAASRAGIDAAWVLQRRRPSFDQEVRLEREGARMIAVREAPSTAPVEPIVVRVSGSDNTWVAGPGSDRSDVGGPDTRVVLDPDRHVAGVNRGLARWPRPVHPVAALWLTQVNLRQGLIAGGGSVWLRPGGDARTLLSGSLSTTPGTLVAARIGASRYLGRRIDGLSRAHRLTAWTAATLLDPRFASVDAGRWTTDAGLVWVWDNRVSELFPLRGHAIAATVAGGIVPGSSTRWGAATLSAAGVWAPHPRLALAAEVQGGVADGGVPHRLLSLGGGGGVRGLAPEAVLGQQAAIGRGEIRTVPIRNASVPLLLLWGSELQLSAGIDVGVVRVDGAPVFAAGPTASVGLIGELLGAEPALLHVGAGWLPWARGVEVGGKVPEIYVSWTQPF